MDDDGFDMVLIWFMMVLPVVPARGGAEVALGLYKTFLIYRTCMRRAPAKPVRACILRKYAKVVSCFTCHI